MGREIGGGLPLKHRAEGPLITHISFLRKGQGRFATGKEKKELARHMVSANSFAVQKGRTGYLHLRGKVVFRNRNQKLLHVDRGGKKRRKSGSGVKGKIRKKEDAEPNVELLQN